MERFSKCSGTQCHSQFLPLLFFFHTNGIYSCSPQFKVDKPGTVSVVVVCSQFICENDSGNILDLEKFLWHAQFKFP